MTKTKGGAQHDGGKEGLDAVAFGFCDFAQNDEDERGAQHDPGGIRDVHARFLKTLPTLAVFINGWKEYDVYENTVLSGVLVLTLLFSHTASELAWAFSDFGFQNDTDQILTIELQVDGIDPVVMSLAYSGDHTP